MAKRWLVVSAVLAMAGCSDRDGAGSASEGSGEGSAGETAGEGQSAEGQSTTSVDATTADSADGTTTDAPCDESPSAGGACAIAGQICSYGDDCGSWTYECQNGEWVQIDGSGCGADPIACEDDPVDGDPCDFDEPCDLDGDCMDVLECDSYNWALYELCSAQYCPAAAPQSGKACDEAGRSCSIETECGPRSFFCFGTYWRFSSGAICEIPQPCSAGPVPNDACDTAGEVCVPPVDALPTLQCDGSTWQPQ